MSDITISLDCPSYLKEFYIHFSGGSHPVTLRKGSPESAILKLFLTSPPEGAKPDIPAPESLVIFLPYSKTKDPRTYNFLPAKAKEAMIEYIRAHFDMKIWREIGIIRQFPRRLDLLIESWMEANGISVSDTNYQSVLKRFRRLQKLDADAERKRKKNARLS